VGVVILMVAVVAASVIVARIRMAGMISIGGFLSALLARTAAGIICGRTAGHRQEAEQCRDRRRQYVINFFHA